MHNQELFNAINDSQEGGPLPKFIFNRGGNPHAADQILDDWDWGDALNFLLIAAYRGADDAGELLTHLRYAADEIRRASEAVRPFANAEEEMV